MKRDQTVEIDEDADIICDVCGSIKIWEDEEFICPHCDGQIDYFGDEDDDMVK
jgi:rubrerythrin